MLGSQLETVLKLTRSFLKVREDWLLERVDVERIQCLNLAGWTIMYIFGKSFHQQEYKVSRKGFEGGLSKQQISNVFNSQEILQSPLMAIEIYSGVRNGKIRANFYVDCQNIPDPSALNPTQKNLLLLDDCFLSKPNKAEAYYTGGRTTVVIRYTLLRTISVYHGIQFGRIRTLLSFSHKTRRISQISMLTIVPVTYPSRNSNSFVIEYVVKSTTL